MPIYEARSLDVLGNPVDGYEVNDYRALGEVYLSPTALETATSDVEDSNSILRELAAKGWLPERPHAPEQIEWEGVDQDLIVYAPDNAWAGFIGDEPRFISMMEPPRLGLTGGARNRQIERDRAAAEAKLRTDETLDMVEGRRPVLELAHQEWRGDGGPDADGVEFWNTVIEYKHDKKTYRKVGPCGSCMPPGILVEMTEDDTGRVTTQRCDECNLYEDDVEAERALHKIRGYGLAIELGFYTPEGRIGIEVRAGDVGDNGAENVSDRFEMPMVDWNSRPTLGFDPVTGEELLPTKSQVSEILVSLDKFLETH